MTHERQGPRAPHLGGHHDKTHVDVGGLEYLEHLIGRGPLDVLDIGCGVCGMAAVVEARGGAWCGVDGVDLVDAPENFIKHDFYDGVPERLKWVSFDLAWSVEFLEHVDARHLPNVAAAFQHCDYAAITANRGGGSLHPNAQDPDYWIDWFASIGYAYLEEATREWKAASTMGREFVQDTGLIFQATI